jgi:hypothetical protein
MGWIGSILGFLYEALLGCRHGRLTRPFTLEEQTYKVCLDCGRQVMYSVEKMRPLSAGEVRRMRMAQMAQVDGTKVVPLTARVRTAVGGASKSRAAA